MGRHRRLIIVEANLEEIERKGHDLESKLRNIPSEFELVYVSPEDIPHLEEFRTDVLDIYYDVKAVLGDTENITEEDFVRIAEEVARKESANSEARNIKIQETFEQLGLINKEA